MLLHIKTARQLNMCIKAVGQLNKQVVFQCYKYFIFSLAYHDTGAQRNAAFNVSLNLFVKKIAVIISSVLFPLTR